MAITNNNFGNMYDRDASEHGQVISVDDVRQASPLGHVRYVLGVSLALVVVLFAVIYFSYSHTW